MKAKIFISNDNINHTLVLQNISKEDYEQLNIKVYRDNKECEMYDYEYSLYNVKNLEQSEFTIEYDIYGELINYETENGDILNIKGEPIDSFKKKHINGVSYHKLNRIKEPLKIEIVHYVDTDLTYFYFDCKKEKYIFTYGHNNLRNFVEDYIFPIFENIYQEHYINFLIDGFCTEYINKFNISKEYIELFNTYIEAKAFKVNMYDRINEFLLEKFKKII